MTTTHLPVTCEHDTRVSARVGDDPVASVWECEDCGHAVPFTDDDYAFANAQPWTPARPVGITKIEWLFMSREARFAAYAG